MDGLPPLPKLEGDVDLLLDVYTHKSLKWQQEGQFNDEYGDTERLAEMGGKLLDVVVTNHFYSKRPMLSATQIVERTAESLSDTNIAMWLNVYGLKAKYKYLPNERETVESPPEMRRFFNTYIGAVNLRSGPKVVQDWISRLIDPEEDPPAAFGYEPPEVPAGSSSNMASSNMAPSHMASSHMASSHMASPPPPTTNPPPLPSGQPPPPGYTPPGHPGIPPAAPHVTVALVNQTASQRGISCSYTAEQTGPPHLPTWTVHCYMNNVEQGCGSGKSQKLAKEEAARQAWQRMGW